MRMIPLFALLLMPVGWPEAQAPSAIWRLSDRPLLSLGSRDTAGPALFGKVVGAVRQGSGAVLVADRLNRELRLFSASGELMKVVGRFGAGPGEFRAISSLRRCSADSAFVYDLALRRVSVFDPSAAYVRAIDPGIWSLDGIPPYDFWCNSHGTLAVLHRSSEPPRGPGPRRPQVAITLVAPNGGLVRLGNVPASERYFHGSEDIARPLGKVTSIALGTTVVYVGTGDAFEVSQFSLQGERLGMVRETRSPINVTPAHVTQYISDLHDRRSGPGTLDKKTREAIYRDLEYPKTFPAYSRLIVDPSDNLWIEDYPVPGATDRGWSVFSKGRFAIARMRVPSNFEILEIGSDHVLGIWRDDLDVEYVRVYRLAK
jgi:hypothetical protein